VTANPLPLILLGYLKKFCQGEGAARTQRRITIDLNSLGLNITTRDVRDGAAALVDLGFPVGTTIRGCFICMDGRDFQHAYRNLAQRMRAQGHRARRFKVLAREALNGQKKFDFAEAERRYADLEAAPLLAAETLTGARCSTTRGGVYGVEDGAICGAGHRAVAR
jgi:hypothetical protein